MAARGLVNVETRLLLPLIPAMLTTLSAVREKELGSIVNLYATPATRLESCSASSFRTSPWRCSTS